MDYNYTETEVLDELEMLDNCEYENVESEMDFDFPKMELSLGARIADWFSNKKETSAERIHEVKNNLTEWYYTRKAEKQFIKRQRALNFEFGIYDKKDLVKSFSKCIFKGTLFCACAAGALMSAVSIATIGFIPAFVMTAAFVGGSWFYNSSCKDSINEFKQIKEGYNQNTNEDLVENVEKEGFFKSLRKCFVKSNNKEYEEEVIIDDKQYTELTTDESNEEAIGVENLVLADTSDIPKVKLTREQKLAKVKEECKLARVKVGDITSYCVFVAKDDIKLQKFIKGEYKKQYPEEKVQAIEMEDKKVLLLNNRPSFK